MDVMTQFSGNKQTVNLMVRYFSGIATPEEIRALERWREESAEHERVFRELSGGDFWKAGFSEGRRADMDGAYRKVVQKCGLRRRRRLLGRLSALAALLLIPLGVGLWLLLNPQQDAVLGVYTSGMKMVKDTILPGEVKAQLVLSDGSTIQLDGSIQDSVARQAGSLIVAQAGGLSYANQEPVQELVYNTLTIPRGGEYTLRLSDGTVVYLNSETVLHYPVQFVGEERRVELSGEAYFEVARDVAHPFIVETPHSRVQVLGTSFNLRSYQDEKKIAATLVEGKVRFIADAGKQVNLMPGEQAVLDGEGRLTKREVDTYLYTAWKDGNFVFYKQPLEEVMRIVARWYDVEVHFIDSSQRGVIFTGNVKRYDDFSKIVRMLEMTGNTEFSINGRNIFIREK